MWFQYTVYLTKILQLLLCNKYYESMLSLLFWPLKRGEHVGEDISIWWISLKNIELVRSFDNLKIAEAKHWQIFLISKIVWIAALSRPAGCSVLSSPVWSGAAEILQICFIRAARLCVSHLCLCSVWVLGGAGDDDDLMRQSGSPGCSNTRPRQVY